MTLKEKDPELFALFLKNPSLVGYVPGFIAGVYNNNPGAVTEALRSAIEAHPDLTHIEALVLSIRDSLFAYHEKVWQEGSKFAGYGFDVELIDDLIKDMASSSDVRPEGRADAEALLTDKYLKVH